MDFNGKVVVITGASHGIGLGCLKKFWEHGAKTVNIDKDDEIFGADLFLKGDIEDENFVKQCVDKIIQEYGKVDFLINNVCDSSKKGILSGCTLEDFMHVQKIGVAIPYYLTTLLKDNFSENAAIVNIASTRAFMSQEDTESYSAAKGAITSLTHALAMSLRGKVRVNCVSPGWIDVDNSKFSKEDEKQHPVGRVGAPEDIANAVLYLCAEESSFITGQNITIDGGMSKQMIYHNDLGWSYNT